MNRADVSETIARLKVIYPNHQTGDYTEEMWLMVFRQTPYADVQRAVSAWIAEEEWFPTPAGLKRYIVTTTPGLPSPDEAWRMVVDRIRATYPGQPAPDWDAPEIVQETVKAIGGLRDIRLAEKPDQMHSRFIKAYQERAKQWTSPILSGSSPELTSEPTRSLPSSGTVAKPSSMPLPSGQRAGSRSPRR